MQLCHDELTAGHLGREKTLSRIRKNFFWNTQRKDVQEYVRTCTTCQRTKARHHRPYGNLMTLPIPDRPFQEISLDFITGLPESKTPSGKVDAILVVVDRFTKYAQYIPTRKDTTAKSFAYTFLETIWRRFGLPEGIVSDRGSIFTSKFWQTMCQLLGTTRKMSTAYHPQTDGQTERMNQQLEHYLRTYCCYEQTDWAEKLGIAEWTYNTSEHKSHGKSPAYLLLGYDPKGPTGITTTGPLSEDALERVTRINKDREVAAKLLQQSNIAHAK